MARIVTTEIVSDLSGRKNAKEVEFYFEGNKYRIALAGAEVSNFTRMMESIEAKMARYTDVAEKIGTVTGQNADAHKVAGKYPRSIRRYEPGHWPTTTTWPVRAGSPTGSTSPTTRLTPIRSTPERRPSYGGAFSCPRPSLIRRHRTQTRVDIGLPTP